MMICDAFARTSGRALFDTLCGAQCHCFEIVPLMWRPIWFYFIFFFFSLKITTNWRKSSQLSTEPINALHLNVNDDDSTLLIQWVVFVLRPEKFIFNAFNRVHREITNVMFTSKSSNECVPKIHAYIDDGQCYDRTNRHTYHSLVSTLATAYFGFFKLTDSKRKQKINQNRTITDKEMNLPRFFFFFLQKSRKTTNATKIISLFVFRFTIELWEWTWSRWIVFSCRYY